jgi:hypothetical protein
VISGIKIGKALFDGIQRYCTNSPKRQQKIKSPDIGTSTTYTVSMGRWADERRD